MAPSRVYFFAEVEAHLRKSNDKTTMCGREPTVGSFFGTGNAQEGLKAETLPLCKECEGLNDRDSNS